MVKGSIVLATEDQLSEEVGLKLAANAGLNVVQKLRQGGNGYLKKRMRNFCEIARQVPVVVLADLDPRWPLQIPPPVATPKSST